MRDAVVFGCMFFAAPLAAGAGDWPEHLGGPERAGISEDAVDPGGKPAWVYVTGKKPHGGFYPPLRAETMGPQQIVAPSSTFDYAFGIAAADGRVFVASSTEEGVFCLDAATGKRLWTFSAEGAVRFAPVARGGLLYFGADDGCVYCVEAATGAERWRYSAAPERRWVLANGRWASQWPVRTSVALHEGAAYFSAGLFPAAGGVVLCAVDAADGAVKWRRPILTPSQGYILVEGGTLLVPNGRAAPAEFALADGAPIGAESELRREGGAAFTAMVDGMVAYGPSEFGILRFRTAPGESAGPASYASRSIRGLVTGIAGWRAVAAGEAAWLLREGELAAYPRERFRAILEESGLKHAERIKARVVTAKSGVQMKTDLAAEERLAGALKWKAQIAGGRSLVATKSAIVVGAKGRVAGFDSESGRELFSLPVEGTAWELAVADGRLLASTDAGNIYAWSRADKPVGEVRAVSGGFGEDGREQAAARALVAAALERLGTRKGHCLVAGVGEGRLALEVARQSEMRVIGVEKNPETLRRARENLARAGVHGDRVVLRGAPDGRLSTIRHFANLVLSESWLGGGGMAFAPGEVFERVRPYGGMLLLVGKEAPGKEWDAVAGGWERATVGGLPAGVAVRGALAGAGHWTHMFADAANTSSSGDELVGGTGYRLQWFGDPSPPRIAGWHANGLGPLFRDGRLFVIKVDHVEAVDAYNGVSLWQTDVPGSARFSPAREGGAACVDEARLFFAVSNDVRAFDVATGAEAGVFRAPGEGADWGFLAVDEARVYGSGQKPSATNTSAPRYGTVDALRSMWSASEVEFAASGTVFALDKKTGAVAWSHAAPGRAVLNASIAVDGARVYFVESRNPAVAADADGSVLLRDFLEKDAYLVALDKADGKKAWEAPCAFGARTMLYLSAADGMLVASYGYHTGPLAGRVAASAASKLAAEMGKPLEEAKRLLEETKVAFAFEAFDAATGVRRWKAEYVSSDSLGTQHNYNVSHPVLAGGTLYHNPAEQYLVAVDMKTGALTEHKGIQRGKGCATPTASARAMFYRSMGIACYDFASGTQFYVSDANRPSCWMSVLPAGGLVLMPEYSVGCNCAFPLQTSVALAPGDYEESLMLRRGGGPAGRGNDR